MKPIKLLLIDDNEDNRTLIKIALEISTDWEVITAATGIEGINKAESELPDVILLDFILPDLDGLAVYKALKYNLFTCTIPIIFVTAMVDTKVLSKLRNTGANGIVTKPFDPLTLAENISKMCEFNFFLSNELNKWNKQHKNLNKTKVLANLDL